MFYITLKFRPNGWFVLTEVGFDDPADAAYLVRKMRRLPFRAFRAGLYFEKGKPADYIPDKDNLIDLNWKPEKR